MNPYKIISICAIIALAIALSAAPPQSPVQRSNIMSGRGVPMLAGGKCETDSIYFNIQTGHIYTCHTANTWVLTNIIPEKDALTLRLSPCVEPRESEVALTNRKLVRGTLKANNDVGTAGKFQTKVASGLDIDYLNVIICAHNP